MALGLLMILTVTIALLAIVGITFMFTVKNEKYVWGLWTNFLMGNNSYIC